MVSKSLFKATVDYIKREAFIRMSCKLAYFLKTIPLMLMIYSALLSEILGNEMVHYDKRCTGGEGR